MKKTFLIMLTLLFNLSLISCGNSNDENLNDTPEFEKPQHQIITQEEMTIWYADFEEQNIQFPKEMPSFTHNEERIVYDEEIANSYNNIAGIFEINKVNIRETYHINSQEKYCQYISDVNNEIVLWTDDGTYEIDQQTKKYAEINLPEGYLKSTANSLFTSIFKRCRIYLMTGFNNLGYNQKYTANFYSDKPGQMYLEINYYDIGVGVKNNTFVNKITAYFDEYIGMMYKEETIYLKTKKIISGTYISLITPTTLKKPNLEDYTLIKE